MKTSWLVFIVSLIFYISCSDKPIPKKVIKGGLNDGSKDIPARVKDKIEITGGLTDSVVNIYFYNTEYDDYNSAMPSGEYESVPFIFSSNRKSKGDNFDIVGIPTQFSFFDGENKFLMFPLPECTIEIRSIMEMLNFINTPFNEYGPFYKRYGNGEKIGNIEKSEFILFYATDKDGNLNIEYVYMDSKFTRTNTAIHQKDSIHGPFKVNLINSNNNEAYLSVRNDKIYYSSDKDGNFDIYELKFDTTISLLEVLKQKRGIYSARKIENCSGNYNDKCPFTSDNILVFASDRPGGFGGYDLYYSRWLNNKWSKAVNFGAKINTEFDEFRPIVHHFNLMKNDMLIFSSNRQGGKGGYDLYLIGIDKIN